MSYVYILKSEKSGRLYIGSTEDVQRRLERHNRGLVSATRNFCPWRLAFYQQVESLSVARATEARLKKYKRRDFIEKIISEGVIRAISSSGRATDS